MPSSEKPRNVRPASQAGRFYPASPDELRRTVQTMLEQARCQEPAGNPVGFVAPHAGYPFSGPTAAHAWRQIQEIRPAVVFVLAPSHHARFPGASIWDGEACATPLGLCPIAADLAEAVAGRLPGPRSQPLADREEHALEVQIPFTQVACPEASIVPMVVGDQSRENIGRLVDAIDDALADQPPGAGRCVFVASSDLYHGHSLPDCRRSDAQLVEDLRAPTPDALLRDDAAGRTMACGLGPIAAVMQLARRRGAEHTTVLHQTTSADAVPHRAGDYVVGYVAAMFH